jgi:hypothetical protein
MYRDKTRRKRGPSGMSGGKSSLTVEDLRRSAVGIL